MAVIEKTGSTKKPSGLTITRNGALKFVVEWKIADKDYESGHQLRWRALKSETKHTGWTEITMSSSATSKTITLSASDWFPTANKPKLYGIEFDVRGKRKKTEESVEGDTVKTTYNWSDRASKTWKMKVPKLPSLTSELIASNKTTFSWEGNNDPYDERPFNKFQYQTVLKKDCKETSGKKITGWGSITSSSSDGSATPGEGGSGGEDTSLLATGSYTRWFRIRSVGAAGYSEWRYAKHVYAKPKKPTIKSIIAKRSNSNTNVLMTWKAPSDASHPIDETGVEYCVDTPRANLNIPADPTWAEVVTSADTEGTDSANFVLSQIVTDDTCLFVRAVTKHDVDVNQSNVTPSNFAIADYGKLVAPIGLDVQISSSHVATITVTNKSEVPDSRVAIICRDEKKKDIIVAITPLKQSEDGGDASQTFTANVPVAVNRAKFGAFAFQGDYSYKSIKDPYGSSTSRTYKNYTIEDNMSSNKVWESGTTSVPDAPGNVTVKRSGTEAVLTWERTWDNATKTELSWSTNKNAWRSTEEPQTYVINRPWVTDWRIAGIEQGNVWYFRIRFIDDSGDEPLYGPYCDRLELDLTATPDTPILKLSKATVNANGSVKASWLYECDDGIKQGAAELCIVTNEGAQNESRNVIARTTTKKSITFKANMSPGETYSLSLRVSSSRGKVSAWSESVPLYVGSPVSCSIYATSISEDETVVDSDGAERTANVLDELPLTATITGAGNGGTTTLIIERMDDYHMERPDGSFKDGYEGETIAIYRQTGESEISIDRGDLIGVLDDGARYRLIAIAEDGNGQRDSEELIFETRWEHQAAAPTASITMEDGIAKITVTAPSGAENGDTCDIYRLSSDNPQLIVQGGSFGTAYVDPYPTIGEHGGYRIVDITKYGDYITSDNQPAWIDCPAGVEDYDIIIDFNGNQVHLPYDITMSNRWAKDFKITRYLDGSQEGDWNPGAIRTATYNVKLYSDDEEVTLMRELADFDGICHIRTPEGSSYACDIQVSESKDYNKWELVNFTLTVTRVEPETLDGVPYSEWVTS